jgi:hypothetical protein
MEYIVKKRNTAQKIQKIIYTFIKFFSGNAVRFRLNLFRHNAFSIGYAVRWAYYKDFAHEFIEIKPGIFPLKSQYTKVILYDVLEHVTSPLKLCKHMNDHLIQGGLLETFIQDIESKNRANLRSAMEEREITFEFLSDHFNLVSGEKGSNPGPRIWEKK